MKLARKKPIIVQVFQLTKSMATSAELDGLPIKGILAPGNKIFFIIKTLEGKMKAKVGDWIIKGIKGEFYPCKPDIFEETYEAVE